METPDLTPDNYSSEYHNYIKQRVQESPLNLAGNRFFNPDYDACLNSAQQESK